MVEDAVPLPVSIYFAAVKILIPPSKLIAGFRKGGESTSILEVTSITTLMVQLQDRVFAYGILLVRRGG